MKTKNRASNSKGVSLKKTKTFAGNYEREFGDLDSTEKQGVVGAGLLGAGGGYVGGKLVGGAKATANYVKSHPELIKGSKLVKSPAYFEAIKKGQSLGGKVGLVVGGLGAGALAYNRLKNRKRT
jgi:hypothetical protein